jgi:apolipoprotein D and lipocalin family protein
VAVRRPTKRHWLALAGLCGLAACHGQPPLPTVPRVDLPRFLGDWYVIAHIPASSEANAHNAVESYAAGPDGTIATTYAFRDGGFDGPFEVMRPNAIVRDRATNATWGMQFFWPIRFEYLITYLDADYETTIVARTARDYAWIMARTPELPEAELQHLVETLRRQGYDMTKLRRVPQRWPDPAHPSFAPRGGAAN